MGKLLSIAHNTFLQTVRQPIYCILVLATFFVLLIALTAGGWTMGESGGDFHETEQKMLQIQGLGTLLVVGVLLAAFTASGALTREIEDRTALTVISKPVSRPIFLMGKFAGVAAATTLAYYIGTIAFLLVVRHQVIASAADPYDWPVIVIGLTALGLALVAAVAGNFFFSWPFTSAFIWSVTACLTAAMAVVLFVGKDWQPVPPGYDEPPRQHDVIRLRLKPGQSVEEFKTVLKERRFTVIRGEFRQPVLIVQADPNIGTDAGIAIARTLPEVEKAVRDADKPVIRPELLIAVFLTFLSLMVLSAVAVAASTRLGLVLTILVCAAVFYLGASHPRLFQQADRNVAIQTLAWVLPNLTYFFAVDVLSRPYETGIPLAFVGLVALYCLLYVGGVLAVGTALFQRRQMAEESSGTSVPGGVNLLAGAGKVVALLAGLEGAILLLEAVPPLWGWVTMGIILAAGAMAWAMWGLGRIGQFFLALVGLALIAASSLAAATGRLAPIILLAAAVLGWFLWSFFGRGTKWSYWLAAVLVAANLVRSALIAAGVKAAWLPRAGQETQPVAVVEALAAAAVILILLLPKTRRHFQIRNPKHEIRNESQIRMTE